MPSVLQFVDSITASPTVRLDLNDGSTWRMVEGTELPPPTLREVIAQTMLTDGGVIPSTAYDLRTLTLVLGLDAASADDAAAALQALFRELDRPRNIIRWQPQGVTNPVFFRTFRTDTESVAPHGAPDNRRKTLTVRMLAEPFAYGLLETPVVDAVVSADPHANGCFVDVGAASWLDLPGAAGDYASTPDHADVRVTGDLDVRVEATLDDWNTGSEQSLLARYFTSTNQRSYRLYIDSAGLLSLAWSVDGVATSTLKSTVAPAVPDGGRLVVRATLDVDQGGTNHDVNFYTASSLEGSWTSLGSEVVGSGTTSIFAGTAPLEIGSINDGALNLAVGRVHAAEVRSGIDGTVVANPVFSAQTPGVTSFADSTGKTWTVNGSAAIEGSPAVLGDVESPAIIEWPVGGTNQDRQTLFAVRRRGTPANVPFVLQAETMTQGTDTTTQPNDATFSGAGNNFSRCTFSTDASMQTRLSVSSVGTAGVDLRGRYRVFARYKKNTALDEINLRVQFGDGIVFVTNDEVTLEDSTERRFADLGEMSIPVGVDPVHDGAGNEISVSNDLDLRLQAERVSGSGTLDVDFLLLVPSDDRTGIVNWSLFATGEHWILDGDGNMAYHRDSSDRMHSAAAPAISGGFPMLSPGQTNRIYMLYQVASGFLHDIGHTDTVSVSYFPRYLSVRPASS